MNPSVQPSTSDYKDVRSLARGLALLQALNRASGALSTTTELAQACGMHRTTVKRLLETLRNEGFVRRGEKDGQYALTFAVRGLSEGFVEDDWIDQVALPLMRKAVPDLLWPCDLATLEGGDMVIRESTHRFSLLSQHRGKIGEKLPVFSTALGRAYISACSEAERAALLSLLQQRTDITGAMARDASAVENMVQETQARGYAVNWGDWQQEAPFSAVAVPVMCRHQLVACINLVFPKLAVTPINIQQHYGPRLKKLALRIGKDMQPWYMEAT